MLSMILALLLAVVNPPTIAETENRILHVQFDPGAVEVCVYLQREVKQTPDSSTNADGYYTPSSCTLMDESTAFIDDDIWNQVMPWFEKHNEPSAKWLYWAVIEYPIKGSDQLQSIPTEVHEVER